MSLGNLSLERVRSFVQQRASILSRSERKTLVSALRTIVGRENVMRFYLAIAKYAADSVLKVAALNGVPSAVVDIPSPAAGIAPRFTMTVELNRDGKIAHLYVVSATQKLTALR